MKTAFPQENLRRLEIDSMPPQVATELLCEPKARLTGSMRRAYNAARQRIFISARQKKPIEVKLTGKLKDKSWLQLSRWLRRTISKRADCQRAYLRIGEETPNAEKLRALLDVRAAQLDILSIALEDEIKRRELNQMNVIQQKEDKQRTNLALAA